MPVDIIFDFKEYLETRRKQIDMRLEQYLALDNPHVLSEAMRYSVLSGGKRLRAVLCLASAEAISGPNAVELAIACACALELIHAFSLVHDDLPALDNDDLRRGKPSNHKVFGEAIAILAGDALFALAIDVLINKTSNKVNRSTLLDIAGEFAVAIGASGMAGGQVDDLLATGDRACLNPSDVNAVESIYKRKTGALIRFATWSGAKLAGANSDQLLCLSQFGETLGLAFQISDDLLDVVGDIKAIGKTPGKDKAAGKLTFVNVYGMDKAKERLKALKSEGQSILKQIELDKKAQFLLESLLDYSIDRSH